MKEAISDLELIQKIKRGDQASFELLVNRHKDFAYKVAFRVLGSAEDAEEVAHDAFVQVYQKARSFKGDSKFTTWFYRMVLNLAIGRTRKKKLDTNEIDDNILELGDATPNSLESMDAQNRDKYLNMAVRSLNTEERMLIALYYYDEMSIGEMEEITGLTKSNMKVKIFRARKKMAVLLSKLLPNEAVNLI